MKRALRAAALAALFAAALVALLRDGGSSPIVWMDTFNDEREVQQCLTRDACTLVGVSTSLPGLMHAVGWLQWRTTLAWLGLDVDAVHVTVLALTAVAAVLVFHLASGLGGAPAGVVAGWLFLDHIDALLRVTALHNSSVLLFLGAVFLLACTAVVERPGAAAVALAALVGAVLANVHVVGVACGVSVAWVALLAPHRRWRLAAFGVALFALATVAIAPGTWAYDLATVLVRPAGHPVLPPPADNPLLPWALFGVGAWAVAMLVPLPVFRAYRRRAHGAVAVLAPVLIAFAIAPRLGLYAEPKYLLHAKAAAAVAAALPSMLLARPLWSALPRLAGGLDVALPSALAAVLLHPGLVPGAARDPWVYERAPTLADLRASATILRDRYGWDARRARVGFKTPYGITAQVGLEQAFATVAPAAPAATVPSSPPRDAMLVVIATSDLPSPLPAEWRVVRRVPQAAAVLVTLRSVIDWSAFEVCTLADGEADWTCTERGTHAGDVPGMPTPGRGWRGRIRVSAALRPVAAGESVAISMPRIATICAGRIVATPAGTVLDADGRHVTLAGPVDVAARIAFEWSVGAPECDVTAYDGAVPFVVEGDAAALGAVDGILRGRVS